MTASTKQKYNKLRKFQSVINIFLPLFTPYLWLWTDAVCWHDSETKCNWRQCHNV